MIAAKAIRTHCQIGIFLVPLLLCLPAPSQATFMETLGIGARAQAMGSAYTAVADDLFAIYHNPAGLAQLEKHAITLGYLYSAPTLHASSTDTEGFAQRLIPYRLRSPYIAMAFNVDKTFKGRTPLHVRVGVLNAIPDHFKSVYTAWDPPPSTPRWVHFGDYWDRVHLQGAVSFQLDKVPWLALGMGFRFIISGKNYLVPRDVVLDQYAVPGLRLILEDILGGKARADGNVDLDVDNVLTPTAGLMLFPTDRLRLGYSFRNSLRLAVDPIIAFAVAALDLPDGPVDVLPVTLSVKFEAYYMPQQHNWGVSYRVLDNLLVAADLAWHRWSAYEHIAYGAPQPRWRDTVNPRVGVEYTPIAPLALRLGYAFQPSPIPTQVAASNYIDNDKHVFSLGAGYTFRDPTHTIRFPMRLNVMIQYLKMFNRTTAKSCDGMYQLTPGSFQASGEALSLGVDLTFYF